MPKSNAQGERSAARGAKTREQLLDAAVALVGEAGWGAVTTRVVADRAGVNPALVHYHFSSVPDLLTTATVRLARQLLTTSAGLLKEHGLEPMLADLGRYSGTDPASLLLAEAFLAANRLPELRTQLAGLVAEFRAEVAEWLRGQGHEHADATALLLGAAMDGLVLHRALDPELDVAAVLAPLRTLIRG